MRHIKAKSDHASKTYENKILYLNIYLGTLNNICRTIYLLQDFCGTTQGLKMKKLISICLFLVIIPSFAGVATVLFTAKDAKLDRNGAQSKLTRGASLQAGDSIITATASSAKIKYSNGTLVTVGENSNYKILGVSPKQEISAELKKGKLESESTENKKESLKTPVIALAVLGTHFKVYAPDSKNTFTGVESGKVQAGNLTVGPGQSVQSTPNGTSFAPFPAAGNISASETTPGPGESSGGDAGADTGADTDSGSDSSGGDSGSDTSLGSDAGPGGASEVSLVGTTVVASSSASGGAEAGIEGVATIAVTACSP